MTVKDVVLAQRDRQFFAIGKYQLIPTTLQGAIDRLNIDTTKLFTDELQEYIFRNYLIKSKRPDVFRYITGDIVDIKRAQRALALEFASVGEPDSGRSHYGGAGGNQASITLAKSADALSQERALYAEAITKGASPVRGVDRTIPDLGRRRASSLGSNPLGYQRTRYRQGGRCLDLQCSTDINRAVRNVRQKGVDCGRTERKPLAVCKAVLWCSRKRSIISNRLAVSITLQ